MGCLALRPPVCHSSSPDEVRPSTGEPDAGDPLVRFGGRGGAIQCAVPTPIVLSSPELKLETLDPVFRRCDVIVLCAITFCVNTPNS